jgi:hypothetical protein
MDNLGKNLNNEAKKNGHGFGVDRRRKKPELEIKKEELSTKHPHPSGQVDLGF